MNKHQPYDLAQMQSLPLETKVKMTERRIMEWYNHYNGDVYVSFSGGKDSTVLLHIARSIIPDIPAVFSDTGLEYPEIREFVKTISNVTWIRPKMNFREVISKYGYPVVSKEISHVIQYARVGKSPMYLKKLNGEYLDPSGNPSRYNCKKWKFLLDAPFKIPDYCCNAMKKNPFHTYEKSTGFKPIIATMASESALRKSSWIKYGCNAFDMVKRPMSRPMSFWTENDVLAYLQQNQIPYCSVYGEIVPDGNGGLKTTGCDRTGCMFCMYGCQLEKSPNRFQRMKETHPKQYQYCMKPWSEGGLGLDAVLNYLKIDH